MSGVRSPKNVLWKRLPINKKLADMRHIGALGGRARGRNLRLRKAGQTPVIGEFSRPHEETAAAAIRRIDALCPWLVGAEREQRRRG